MIELKRDVQSEVVLNQLFKFTSLQTSYGINMLALNKGVPELLNLKRSIQLFIDFRKDVIFKRTRFHLKKTREKAHILLGLSVALENIDKVIEIIKSSKDTNEAKDKLIGFKWKIPSDRFLLEFIKSDNQELISENFKLSESQSKSILEIKLSRLTNLERVKLVDDLKECVNLIADYLDILSSKKRLNSELIKELTEINKKIESPRRTEISETEEIIDDESLISSEEVVVTLTNTGYIKEFH